mmetsp:Transcript_26243/g.62145  ORF Transcript_26243/g.62145 Transcript_26243/m.62145 type:complete len:369 (+) Transcript_26243:299-1405(+)
MAHDSNGQTEMEGMTEIELSGAKAAENREPSPLDRSSHSTQEHIVCIGSESDRSLDATGPNAEESLDGDASDEVSVSDNTENGGTEEEQQVQESYWVRQMRTPKFWYILAGFIAFLLASVLAGTQIFEAIIASKQWFLDNKPLSVPWYCIMFSVASAAFMPYGPFCISIGYIFGIGVGFAVQSLAIFVSSAFIYVIGRLFLRKRVDAWLSQYRLWRAIMDTVGRDHLEAAKINILMCFIPMPYGTHAYLFSISRCAFWNFVSVFELGMVGHTFLNLAVGDALALASESEQSQTLRLVGTLVGAVAMVLSIWYGGVVTQRIMDECYTEDKVMDKLKLLSAQQAPAGETEGGGEAGVEMQEEGRAAEGRA